MSEQSLESLLSELEAARYRFGPGESARVLKLLRALDATHFPDAAALIRFHEALLFLRAFPQGPAVVRSTERILNHFHKKVEALRKAGADMDDFDPLEVSGIAGTQMEDTVSFDVARWLLRRMPGKVEIAWDNYEPGRELGNTGPRFMPLLGDDAYVEADTPWRRWLETAGAVGGRKKKSATAAWLIERFERLPLPAQQKAELYDSLRVPLRWDLGNSCVTRTRNWKPVRKVFYHDGPLISRSQISLADELAKRPPSFTRLSLREGEAVTNQIREVMLVRYRELYGTTLADPRSVVRADLGNDEAGRGVSIYLWNLPPDRRLPLRAYVTGFTLKNGVPINYIEAIGLGEWMEVGFNTFYTFRGGEAGWIYAQVLRCLCSWMGTTVVSVYPYQLGHDNDEAIESGAFWFYRKLGFRPGRADLLKLVEREERKIAADHAENVIRDSTKILTTEYTEGHGGLQQKISKYRTPARTLKRLAAGHVFYDVQRNDVRRNELPGSEVGAWDTFSTRNIGLRVNRRMAREFGGDAVRMRDHARRALERVLDVKIAGLKTDDVKSGGLRSGGASTSSWTPLEKAAFEDFALVLARVPGLRAWTREEKEDLVRIIRAKAKPNEMLYLHLTQQHGPLRKALLTLGS